MGNNINRMEGNMIKLKHRRNVNTQRVVGEVGKETLLNDSRRHKGDVNKAIQWMAERLINIGTKHDWTKIEHIDELYADFSATQDGFQADFKEMHWFKDLHLQERHHLTDRCPEDVNLFDVMEKIADSVTAGIARNGSVYDDNIAPEILVKAYHNTMKLLINEIEVEDE